MVFPRPDLEVMPPSLFWAEANAVGWSCFAINYFFAAQNLLARLPLRWFFPSLIFLPFAICIFWIAILFFSSLLLRAVRSLGIFHSWPDRFFQSVVVGILTSIFALALARQNTWLRLLGLLWFAILAFDLAARFFYHARQRARK